MKENIKERKDRRRGLLLAIMLHSLVVGVFIYPFLLTSSPKLENYETIVEFDFREDAASAAASAKVRERNNVTHPVTERKAAPKNPAPAALPSTPAPPILSEPSPLPPVVDLPTPKTPNPEPAPVLKPDPSPAPVVVDVKKPKPGPATSTVESDGDANGSGKATGSPETGNGSTVADAGEGKSPIGSALEGDGVLVRKVIYRPNLDEVVKENGAIVLNICINRRGNVIGVKWNEEKSTIADTDLVKLAIDKAREYKFKTDLSAPVRECGTLSISIKGL